MSTPITSGAVNWTTPVTIGSNGLVSSTDLNALNYDAEFLYTKPYSAVFLTANTGAIGTATQLFTSGTSVISNTPGSGAITFSAGTWTVPLTGLYRFTLVLNVGNTSSAARFYGQLNLGGATGGSVYLNTNNGITNNGSGIIQGISYSFIYPMSATAGAAYPHTASWYFNIGASQTAAIQGGNGATTNTGYQSYASVEYLGNNANY